VCDYVEMLGYICWGTRETEYGTWARVASSRVASSRARGRAIGLTPRRFSYEIHEGIVRLDRASRKKKEIVRGAVRDRVARRASVSVSVSRVDDVKALIMVDMNEWARARGPRRTRVDRVCGRKTRVGDVGWAR